MGESPPEQYKTVIKYLSEDPTFKNVTSTLIPQLKKEQRKVKKDWKYRGTSWEHRI